MKTKMIKLLIALLFITGSMYAQTGNSKQKDVQEIKNRTLIVVTEEPSAKLLKDLNGDQLETYKKDVADYNSDIKEAVTRFWKFNDKIEYKTRDEVSKLKASKSTGYAYLEYSKFTVNTYTAAAYRATLNLKDTKSKPTGLSLGGGDYVATQINIRLVEDNPLGVPVLGIRLPSPFPNKADLALALKQMQLQFGYKLDGKTDIQTMTLFKQNAKTLANLTLLVDGLDTDVSPDELKKVYPYPAEIVTKDKIDEAILSSDPKYAVVRITPFGHNGYGFSALSATDATELAQSNDTQSTGVSLGGVGLNNGSSEFNKNKLHTDHFKLFARYVK